MYDHNVLEVWHTLHRAATATGKWIYRFQICDTTHKNQIHYVLLLDLNLLQTEICLRDLNSSYQCCLKMQVLSLGIYPTRSIWNYLVPDITRYRSVFKFIAKRSSRLRSLEGEDTKTVRNVRTIYPTE